MLKLLLQADRKATQALKQRLPPIIDGIEALEAAAEAVIAGCQVSANGAAPNGTLATGTSANGILANGILANGTGANGPLENVTGPQWVAIGIVVSESADLTPARLDALRARFPGTLADGGVFVLPARATNFVAFEAWCADRARTLLDHVLSHYAASQIATSGLRRHAEQLGQSLARAEALFNEFRHEPLRLAHTAERAGTHALPLPSGEDDGPRTLVIRQTVRQHIANVRYLDVCFNGDGRNLEGIARLTARAAWSGTVLCDATVDIRELGRTWTQFRCDPLDGGDEEPLAIELHMSGADLGWLVPAFSHASPIAEDCATIEGHGPIGRPLALRIWSGIPGIGSPVHAGAHVGTFGPREGRAGSAAGLTTILAIAPEQLGLAELVSKLPPDVPFAPVSYDTASQSVLVHPLGPRPTVARLPPVSVANMSALSAIVQLTDAAAQPAEFAMLALPASGRTWPADARGGNGEIDLNGAVWHEFRAREWGEVEVAFPEPLDGEIDIYLLTRTKSTDYAYTSAWFHGLRMTCLPPAAAPAGP